MRTLATRILELSYLEGLEYKAMHSLASPADPRTTGLKVYSFFRKAKASMTVSSWMELGPGKMYPGHLCSVFNVDGVFVRRNNQLENVRETSEVDQ